MFEAERMSRRKQFNSRQPGDSGKIEGRVFECVNVPSSVPLCGSSSAHSYSAHHLHIRSTHRHHRARHSSLVTLVALSRLVPTPCAFCSRPAAAPAKRRNTAAVAAAPEGRGARGGGRRADEPTKAQTSVTRARPGEPRRKTTTEASRT